MIVSSGLEEAVFSTRPVRGLTHNFYRYPARFSPEFVRQTVLAFTSPSECVLDPFVGGGTTVVESLALGRRAIGIDINSLAYFATLVKTTPLSSGDVESILLWASRVLELAQSDVAQNSCAKNGPPTNMPPELGDFLMKASRMAGCLRIPRQRRFAYCAVLRTGQLALDCRSRIPAVAEVKQIFKRLTKDMIRGLEEFVSMAAASQVPKNRITSMRQVILGSAADSFVGRAVRRNPAKPTLVLTSPPYPGIHVLYNKWQVLGRRETAAHYQLAGLNDGRGPSYYTMGSRSPRGADRYFENLYEVFGNLRQVVDSRALVVQLVGFPDQQSTSERYLSTMDRAGFEQIQLSDLEEASGCVTRTVPNRRWYARYHDNQSSGREVLMIHRVKG